MPEGLVAKEETSGATAPAPEQVSSKPSAAASQAQSLSDQYDLGDTSLEVLEPTAQATPAPEEPAPPARDEKGRYLPKPKTYEHSASWRRRAEELGMSAGEIGALSPEDLKDEVLDRRWKQAIETRGQAPSETRQAGSPPEGQGRPAGQESDPAEITLDEAQFDPALVSAFKKLADDNKSLRDRLAQVEQYAAGQQQMSLAARADRVFAKYEDVLGKGRGHELDPNSDELARRKVILSVVDSDKGPGTIEQKIERAYARIYGGKPQSKPEPEPKASGRISREEWAEAGLARPTHRGNGQEPKGERKAVATAGRIMRERGYYDDGDGDPKFLE